MILASEIREAAAKRKTERKPLEVPNWGLTGERAIRFRNLNERDYLSLRERAKEGVPDSDEAPQSIAMFVEMVATCAVDAEGNAFLDNDEGRALLRDTDVTPHPMLVQLADEAMGVNGLGEGTGG